MLKKLGALFNYFILIFPIREIEENKFIWEGDNFHATRIFPIGYNPMFD